ncbi:MAG: carboxypeptidase-like regulatory domain-containing protein [Planctomycetaceae bacterium]|jgi:hypothetical protein|nr:carboxypeptidase-like regulatory domain-containing protein [Planctomycetaceae bacterium]
MLKKFSNLRISFTVLLFVLLLFSGCGNRFIQFGGKVTDSDGQPYTKGSVIFTNEKVSARGKLQSDGTYKLESLKKGDGLAPGKYQVSLSGHHETIGSIAVSDIDDKYESASTSGLSCEVTKGGRFDFTVELKKK